MTKLKRIIISVDILLSAITSLKKERKREKERKEEINQFSFNEYKDKEIDSIQRRI